MNHGETAIGPNNDTCQVWSLDGNDQWTDALKILFRGKTGFAVLVEGSFTGTPVLQARRAATVAPRRWDRWAAAARIELTWN